MKTIRDILGTMSFFFGFIATLITILGNEADALKYGFVGVQLLLIALIIQVAKSNETDYR